MEASSRDRESDLPYPRHALPAHPRVADYVLFYPRSVQVYFSRLCARFGWRCVGLRVCTYEECEPPWTSGKTRGWGGLGRVRPTNRNKAGAQIAERRGGAVRVFGSATD
jgi:hypothetical protein